MELITKFEHDEKIIGWVHSHVRGIKCFFSSLDVHNQYLSQRLDSNHLGLVVQIHPDGSLVDHDYYQLTSLGMTTVTNCLNGSFEDNSKQLKDEKRTSKYCSCPGQLRTQTMY